MNLGPWAPLIRTVAGHDFDRSSHIARWPVRELLLAYLQHARVDALAAHRHAELAWLILGPWRKKAGKPPALPRILKDPEANG